MLVRVVKIGGNELDQPAWVSACAEAVRRAGPVVLVHGGGRAISALCERLALPVEKREGIRVTTPEIAAAVEMVLAGPINRQLVAALRGAGLDAIGLAGVDGGLLTARRVAEPVGHVGEITAVRASLLESLLLAGLTPVVAPVAPEEGTASDALPLNVNADQAAAAVAGALRAAELLFVSDVPGVLAAGATQTEIAVAEIAGLIAAGVAKAGMAAKLRAAAAALASGTGAVRIGDLTMLERPSAGTRIVTRIAQPA